MALRILSWFCGTEKSHPDFGVPFPENSVDESPKECYTTKRVVLQKNGGFDYECSQDKAF